MPSSADRKRARSPNVVNLVTTSDDSRRRSGGGRQSAGAGRAASPAASTGRGGGGGGNADDGPQPPGRKHDLTKSARYAMYHHVPRAVTPDTPRTAGRVAAAAAARNAEGLVTRFGSVALKPHQVDVVRVAVSRPGVLCWYKVGSGKTIAAIAAAENLMLRDPRRTTYVVVPASLQTNFRKELVRTGVNQRRYRVLTHENVRSIMDAVEAPGRKVLVVDEAHLLREGGLRYTAVLELSKRSDRRVLLTGTPVVNHPVDVAPLLALVAPTLDLWVRAHVRASTRRSAPRGNPRLPSAPDWKWKAGTRPVPSVSDGQDIRDAFAEEFGVDADKNEAELIKLLWCTTLFYEPTDPANRAKYPTSTQYWVRVYMTQEQKRQHLALVERLSTAELKERFGADDPDKHMAYLGGLRRIALSAVERRDGRELLSAPKFTLAADKIAEAARAGRKSIVYSAYVQDGVLLMKRFLAERGVEAATFTGKDTKKQRDDNVRRYNAGEVKVVLLSKAGGLGLDLKNTSQIHVMEPDWNEENIAQVVGRGVRYESHDGSVPAHVDVFRYVAVMPGGVDAFETTRPSGFGDLRTVSGDEKLQAYSENKARMCRRFLHLLRAAATRTLTHCMVGGGGTGGYAQALGNVANARQANDRSTNAGRGGYARVGFADVRAQNAVAPPPQLPGAAARPAKRKRV